MYLIFWYKLNISEISSYWIFVNKANLIVGNKPSSAAKTFVLKSPSFSLIELYSTDVPISKPGKNLNPIFDDKVSLLPFQKPPFENVFQAEIFLWPAVFNFITNWLFEYVPISIIFPSIISKLSSKYSLQFSYWTSIDLRYRSKNTSE